MPTIKPEILQVHSGSRKYLRAIEKGDIQRLTLKLVNVGRRVRIEP